jgi:hypothetical protein
MTTAAFEPRPSVAADPRPPLPRPRGPLSGAILTGLDRRPSSLVLPRIDVADAATDDDLQLALYCCYELHYRGFEGVDEEWEWSPALLSFRRELEDAFLSAVIAAMHSASHREPPSLSGYMETRGTIDQFREFCIHRSAYQLKEADPHTWAIPRIGGRAKAGMVEIQADEYGDGRHADMHAELFRQTMVALDLDPTYGAYIDVLPGTTLATGNLVSLFGLHRRWRGALVGHLARFEMTSVTPMSRYSAALERLGVNADARRFYDVHVEADAHHEVVALDTMVAGLLETEPDLGPDITFGADALDHVEARFAYALLDAWAAGTTSLLASPR